MAMRLFWWALLFCLATAQAAVVGRIEAAGGQYGRQDDAGTSKPAMLNGAVEAGDTLITGHGGWMVLAMSDGASLTLRPNTQLRIDEYRYQAEQVSESRAWLRLVRGALRSVTGLIGQSNRPSYRLATPTMTIGIRGTDHETVLQDHSADADTPAGVYEWVHDGESVMQVAGQELAVRPGESGYLPVGDGALPRLLAQRPRLFERLQQFGREQGLDQVLERLHDRGEGGFRARPLSPEQREQLIEQGRQAVRERMEALPPGQKPDREQVQKAVKQRLQKLERPPTLPRKRVGG